MIFNTPSTDSAEKTFLGGFQKKSQKLIIFQKVQYEGIKTCSDDTKLPRNERISTSRCCLKNTHQKSQNSRGDMTLLVGQNANLDLSR